MTLTASSRASVDYFRAESAGISTAVYSKRIEFSAEIDDCTAVYAEKRTFGPSGFDEIDFAGRLAVVKLLLIKNLSATASIGLSAGWTGTQFSIFRQDITAWNFSPMVNLGSLTLRGFPVRPRGSWFLSCPDSDGFATTAGGSILRIGGTQGQMYEFLAMGT